MRTSYTHIFIYEVVKKVTYLRLINIVLFNDVKQYKNIGRNPKIKF